MFVNIGQKYDKYGYYVNNVGKTKYLIPLALILVTMDYHYLLKITKDNLNSYGYDDDPSTREGSFFNE